MIYLTTGTPGSFKTLSTLMFVEKFRQDELKEGRERNVFYYGINDLTLPCWFSFDEPRKWYELPENSIIVIDECQKEECGFGAKSHLSKQDKTITELETHRHKGFDIFLITQGPHLINSRIKPLTNVHRHLRRVNGWDKAQEYTSDGIITNPENKNNLKDIPKKWFKPDKKFYDVYKSATMHTVKKRIPKLFWVLLVIILIGLYAGFKSYNNFKHRVKPVEDNSVEMLSLSSSGDFVGNFQEEEKFNPIVEYEPRIENMPETAPAYDELRKPKTFPKPNCMMTVTRCECYTQQATLMKNYPDELCRHYVINGRFEPTKADFDQNNGSRFESNADVRRLSFKGREPSGGQIIIPEYTPPKTKHFTTHWERDKMNADKGGSLD